MILAKIREKVKVFEPFLFRKRKWQKPACRQAGKNRHKARLV
jgi:hypothetical protein